MFTSPAHGDSTMFSHTKKDSAAWTNPRWVMKRSTKIETRSRCRDCLLVIVSHPAHATQQDDLLASPLQQATIRPNGLRSLQNKLMSAIPTSGVAAVMTPRVYSFEPHASTKFAAKPPSLPLSRQSGDRTSAPPVLTD